MSSDRQIRTKLEAWAVSVLAALTDQAGAPIFKTVDHWRHQIGLAGGGLESVQRFAPFAIVKYQPEYPDRAGDEDLTQVRRLAVAVGQYAKGDGVAVSRIGSATVMGALELAERVIAALEDAHPGAGFDCDHFTYAGENEIMDHPDFYGLELYFDANNIFNKDIDNGDD